MASNSGNVAPGVSSDNSKPDIRERLAAMYGENREITGDFDPELSDGSVPSLSKIATAYLRRIITVSRPSRQSGAPSRRPTTVRVRTVCI